MSLFRRVLHGCWTSHGNLLRERYGKSYVLVCDVCGTVIPFPSLQLRVKRVKKVKVRRLAAVLPMAKRSSR